jgi:putative ATPase
MPEASNALAQLVVYLATAPKSNALYTAYAEAAEDARKTSHYGVPLHIRNAPTKLMKDLNYGKDYHYTTNMNISIIIRSISRNKCGKDILQTRNMALKKKIQKRIDWWLN